MGIMKTYRSWATRALGITALGLALFSCENRHVTYETSHPTVKKNSTENSPIRYVDTKQMQVDHDRELPELRHIGQPKQQPQQQDRHPEPKPEIANMENGKPKSTNNDSSETPLQNTNAAKENIDDVDQASLPIDLDIYNNDSRQGLRRRVNRYFTAHFNSFDWPKRGTSNERKEFEASVMECDLPNNAVWLLYNLDGAWLRYSNGEIFGTEPNLADGISLRDIRIGEMLKNKQNLPKGELFDLIKRKRDEHMRALDIFETVCGIKGTITPSTDKRKKVEDFIEAIKNPDFKESLSPQFYRDIIIIRTGR